MSTQLPDLPADLAGWRWLVDTKHAISPHYRLQEPDSDWTTKGYYQLEKAIAEARRRVLSTPKAKAEPPSAALVATGPAAIVGVVMMDEAEARESIDYMRGDLDQIDTSISSFRQRALVFKEREGWRPLGYSGFIEAIRGELGADYSKSYLSRLLDAAEIERVLELPIGNSVPESQLRPLGALTTPADQRAAWERARDIAGDGPRTAKHVQQAVAERTPRLCFVCGLPWGAPGSMLVGGERHCPSCASAAMQEQARQQARQQAATRTPPPDFPIVAARLAALGWRLESTGADRFTMYPPGDRPGIGNATWHGVTSRLEAIERAAQIGYPSDFDAIRERAAAIGLILDRNDDGDYSLKNPGGSGVDFYDWTSILKHLVNQERAHAQNEADRQLSIARAAAIPDAPATIPADIAAAAAQLALAVETRDDGRLLLYWPDEVDQLHAMDPLPPDVMREWLASDAPRQAMARAELLGWKPNTHKRAGQTLHAYHRAADERETAEYADQALAAGEALRIAAKNPLAACSVCGSRPATKRPIGGDNAARCPSCAIAAERDDLTALLDAQYLGTTDRFDGGGPRHRIQWDSGASGAYTYDEALATYHSSAMQVRRLAAGSPTDPRAAASAWLDAIRATLKRAAAGTMFRASEMEEAARHVAALLAESDESGPVPTLANILTNPLAPIEQALANVESLIRAGLTGDHLPGELRACRRQLDALVEHPHVSTADYDALSARIGAAQRAHAELETADAAPKGVGDGDTL